jgi:hypothetical protein
MTIAPEFSDSEGNKLFLNNTVLLLGVPDSLLDDLPDEDQDAILKLVGKHLIIQGFHENHELEIEYVYPKGSKSYCRSIWVDPSFVVLVKD